jgi:hypothetical protein
VPGQETEVTAVRSLLYRGDRAGALALVAAGAEPNVFDLAALGDGPGLRRALAADSNSAVARSADGFTALHFAAYLGGAAAVDVLLESGADPRARNDEGRDAQSFAADHRDSDSVSGGRESGTSSASD